MRAVLVAGGTGGHINAAIAVGEALESEGWDVQYLTGKRPLDYKLFANKKVKHLSSRPLRTKNPFKLLANLALNFSSFASIFFAFLFHRPKAVVGAGGYVCGPTLLAGFLLGIPVFIIEQNAVMGLTNRILGWFSSKIFVHFTKTRGLSEKLLSKVVVVGNPTRKSIQPTSPKKLGEKLRVLVFGGSLGATQINKVIADILTNPPIMNLEIHHQLGDVTEVPESRDILYTSYKYIEDMQAEYEWCDVIISRSGASTISELAIIKKPVLIFPFPAATDNHQFYNAEIFKEESDFTVEVLNPKITHEEGVSRTKEFLLKASKEELQYTRAKNSSNDSCKTIIREIKNYVGMA